MIRFRHHVAILSTINAGVLFAVGGQAGSWQNGAPFGATLQGDLYTPTTPPSSPAILVVIHMCTGHSSTVHSWFQSYADQYGFYLIAPDAGKQCFDSSATRAGDRAAIVQMVDYVVTNKHADKNRVFTAGMSSGGCMTNTLLTIYPDVFVGGSAMPGFPGGAWPAGDTNCSKCGSNPPSTDGKYWGDIARNAFAWSGTYPCAQQWVGGGDEYNFNGWLPAVAAQFQNLGNLGSGTAGTGAPSGWTRTVYKDASGNVRLETNLGPASQKHDLETVNPPLYGKVVTFLGLDKPTGSCGVTSAGSGGTSSTGGAASMGGMTSSAGAANSGGTVSSGGGANAAGGVTSSGGSTGSGGATNGGTGTSTAGSSAASGTPGISGAGGSTAASGGSSTATTGGSTASGGSPASSGATSTAGSADSAESSSGSNGCGCIVAGRSAHGPIAGLLAALGAIFARRRRARR